MRQSSLCVLTGVFLLLCLHMAQPEWRELAMPKPGKCPEFSLRCPFMMLPQCQFDKGCKKDMKCCFYNCRRQCMTPWENLD